MLLTITGPSGVGKTSICEKILESPLYERVVTSTTRSPRKGEQDKIDYHFFSKQEFEEKIENGEFLEYALVYDHYYGVLKKSISDIITHKKHAVLVIDIQGFKTIKKMNLDYHHSFFIMPPSIESLETRLRNRKLDSEDAIQKRLQKAKKEMSESQLFDVVVVNNTILEAALLIRTAVEH